MERYTPPPDSDSGTGPGPARRGRFRQPTGIALITLGEDDGASGDKPAAERPSD